MPDRYQLPDRHETLELAEWPGAVITVRVTVPVTILRELSRVEGMDGDEVVRRFSTLFIEEGLVDWNLADRHGDLPLTEDGLNRLPLGLISDILAGWIEAVTRPSKASRRRSRSGGTSPGRRASRSQPS